MTREDIKTITDIVHKTIYGFFDVCGDDEETPMTDKDKLLLKINKALCNNIKALEQEPKMGHWSRKTKVDAYDIAGVKTWGIKCQCDRCDFTTIVVEDFGYYKYCPNCGARMVEPQESDNCN